MTRTVTILDDYQDVARSVADWSALESQFEIHTLTEHLTGPDLVARLAHSEVVVAMRERTAFTAELFDQLPVLRLLVSTGMSNASIDLDAARARGIAVVGTRGGGRAVQELTMGMMIALSRHIADEDAAVRSGRWQHTIGPELHGKTLGAIGLGRLGSAVATLAQAFGMDVIAWSPSLTTERAREQGVRSVSKEELLSTSDFVTIHVALNAGTRGLVGERELRLMKPAARLVNTSRGPIVDEAALIAALRDGRIAGAALDVYDLEPLPVDHPLRSTPNTLLLPHIGYVSTDMYKRFYADAVDDIVHYARGEIIRPLS